MQPPATRATLRRRSAIAALVLVIAATLVPVGASSAATSRTWWVAPGRTGDCSSRERACGTLTAAVRKAVGGDEILLLDGTYRTAETISKGQAQQRHVRIAPAPNAKVVVSASWTVKSPFLRFEGYRAQNHTLRFVAGGDDGIVTGVVATNTTIGVVGGDRVTISGNRITDNRNIDLVAVGNGSDHLRIERNVLARGLVYGTSSKHLDCVQLWGPGRDIVIRGNTISGCDHSSMMIGAAEGPIDSVVIERNAVQRCLPKDPSGTIKQGRCAAHYAIQLAGNSSVTGARHPLTRVVLRNNTIDGGLLVIRDVKDVTATGNVFGHGLERTTAGVVPAGLGLNIEATCTNRTFRNNIVTRLSTKGCTALDRSNRIGVDVTYVDRSRVDLRLAPRSAGIDHGMPSAPWPDLAGRTAPLGPIDAGAFEHSAGRTSSDPPTTTTSVATPSTTAPTPPAPDDHVLVNGLVTHEATGPAVRPVDPAVTLPVTARLSARIDLQRKPSDQAIAVQVCFAQQRWTAQACSPTAVLATEGVHTLDLAELGRWWRSSEFDASAPVTLAKIVVKDPATGKHLLSSGCGTSCYAGTDLAARTPVTGVVTLVAAP